MKRLLNRLRRMHRERIAHRLHTPWAWMDRTLHDLRYGARLLRRRPAFSVTAVVTLAIGVGGATAIFGLQQALLLRTLPVDRPHELVRLAEPSPVVPSGFEAFTLVTRDTLQRESRTLSGVMASSALIGRPSEISVDDEPRQAFVQFVSDNYFDVLGIGAYRGRVFHQPVPGAPGEPIAVISDDFWRRQYGADTSAIGARFRSGARQFVIAGVAPPGFRGTEVDVPVDIWIPVEQVLAADDIDRVRGRWMRVMARLGPGVTAEQAEAEAGTILDRPVQFRPGGIGYSTLRLRLAQPLLMIALVVGLVLLIGCANLANLTLAATVSRAREIAVRTAVGASRGQVVRQLMTESVLLSTAGGVLGVAAASGISGALLAFLPPDQAIAIPNLRFELDARVLAFAVLLSAATCVLFGTAPALRGTGGAVAVDLRGGGGATPSRRGWLGRGLIVSQVVMCTVLLIVAGVFLRSLQNLRGQDAGYREERLLVADVTPPREYAEPRRDQILEELRERIATLPGVEIAAFSHVGQLSGGAINFRIRFPGRVPSEVVESIIEQRISPGFLDAMGTPLVAGRDVAPSDNERAPLVAIVNETFARRYVPGRNPIGERFFRETGTRGNEPMEVVGVVTDSKWLNLRDDSPPMYYRPYRQMGGTPTVRLAIRTSGDPEPLAGELVRIAQSIDRRMQVSNAVPFREVVDRTIVIERLVGQVSTGFGVLALLIAAVGLYGVLAYGVARRRREIGVRMTVGARPREVEWMFVRESLTLVALGVAVGLPAAMVATRFVSSMLFGVGPQDPATIATAVSVLACAALAATYLPARRAAAIDPVRALRDE